MFTLPPFPPKDYVIRNVTKSLQSSSQFTPISELRVTQRNLGKYCFPLEYDKNECPSTIDLNEIEPVILDKWTNEQKADWVIRPGKDDFFLHNLHNKYFIKQSRKSFDHRFKHKERVFNRSYKLELSCMEEARLEKLMNKCAGEVADFEHSYEELLSKQKSKEKPQIQVESCKHEAPFWWQHRKHESSAIAEVNSSITQTRNPETPFHPRWQEEPNLTSFVKDDPCKRKFDMQLVGQPFKNEACSWYYKMYPPPDIKFRHKKMA